jgi:hypothetical protein
MELGYGKTFMVPYVFLIHGVSINTQLAKHVVAAELR